MVNFWAPETVPDRYADRRPLPPQPERHADAHHRRGVPRDRRLDRREAQRLPRPGPLPDPRARRLRPRRRGRRLPRPAGRRRPLRRARSRHRGRPPTAASPGCPSTSTTRSSPTPSSPPTGRSPEAPCPPSPAPRSSPGSTGMVADGRADHRRRRRHRPLGQVRGGRRHRPHRHLQLRPLPHGRPRLGRRAARLRQRQRDREGDGRRGAAGRPPHPGPRRRQRHRPVPADGPVPRRAEGDGLLRRAELPDRRPLRRHHAHARSRRPAWATASRSR